MNRYKLFDQARGLAIVAMVMANMAPLLAEEVTVGLWFRVLSSISAPIFVMVAGIMVALTSAQHNFMYFLWRGLFVVGMGAVVDVAANMMMPFQGFDVLYLMGVMMPVAYLVTKLKTPQLVSAIVALFILSFSAHSMLGYQSLPLVTYLSGEILPKGVVPIVWRHWLVDGWFPLLPWLPLGLVGILFARFYQASTTHGGFGFARTPFIVATLGFVVVGVVISMFEPSPFLVRHGYVELFYPPNPAFVLMALGVVGLVLVILELLTPFWSPMWLQTFGSMTLAMYTLHLLIIGHVLDNVVYPIHNLTTFYLIFAGHLVALTLSARFIKFARETYTGMPVMLKWLTGK